MSLYLRQAGLQIYGNLLNDIDMVSRLLSLWLSCSGQMHGLTVLWANVRAYALEIEDILYKFMKL